MAEVKAVITGERSGGTNRIVAYTILADGVEVYHEETTVDGLTTDADATEVVRQIAEVRAQQVLAVVQAVEAQPLKGVEIPLTEATAMLAAVEKIDVVEGVRDAPVDLEPAPGR